MKKILSYTLLCIYAMFMIKPIMPTITDVFAHLLNYSDHIATVHREHGKFHVHYEYIEEAKKHSHGDTPYNNNVKKTDGSNEYILFTGLIDFSVRAIPQDHSKLILRCLPVIYLHQDFRPPIAALA